MGDWNAFVAGIEPFQSAVFELGGMEEKTSVDAA
jgi:hypothetical protein